MEVKRRIDEYYGSLKDSLLKGERVLVKTNNTDYFDDCVTLLAFLSKRMNVILITFEARTRDLIDEVVDQGGDLKKIYAIDAISIIMGKGTPPIPKLITVYRPDQFNDIEVYANLFIKRIGAENLCVFMYSVHNLENYQDQNEVGLFLSVFGEQIARNHIPEIIVIDERLTFIMDRIITQRADKIMKIKKIPLTN